MARFRRRLPVPAAVTLAVALAFGGRGAAPPASARGPISGGAETGIILALPYPAGERYRLVQGYGGGTTHRDEDVYALDFAMRPGRPVLASADGTVARAATGWGNTFPEGPVVLGNHVEIDHGWGLVTTYGHLMRVSVRPGERVTRGQRIGLAGNSGYSPRPHLHLSVERHWLPVRPEPMSGYTVFRPGLAYLSDNAPSPAPER